MPALADGGAVIDIAFDVDDAWDLVEAPIDGIHGKAEHEDGEGPSHVDTLSDDSRGEELSSHCMQDTPSGEQVHCILDEPCWAASGKHDIDCPVRVDLFEGLSHVDEEGPVSSRSCWMESTAFCGSRKWLSIDCDWWRCLEQWETTRADRAPSRTRWVVLGMPSGWK